MSDILEENNNLILFFFVQEGEIVCDENERSAHLTDKIKRLETLLTKCKVELAGVTNEQIAFRLQEQFASML